MERLKNPQEFSLVYKQGRPHFGKHVVVSVLPTGRECSRVGFAVGKKVGNAVTRNKVKRRLRAIMQNTASEIAPGFDIIIGAKRTSVTVSFAELEGDLRRVLKLSGIGLTQNVHGTRVGEGHA